MTTKMTSPIGRAVKTAPKVWVETARNALIEEGIAGVRVDRLAQRLGVTRGGFYHNFRDREKLLDALLKLWEHDCRFLPDDNPGSNPGEAMQWYDRTILRLIEEDGYDHAFDMAGREWSRSDKRAAWAVERSDRERVSVLEKFFRVLGYSAEQATIRAKVLYYHQIGYYAISVKETTAERKRQVRLYTDILCGHDIVEAAREAAKGRLRLA